MTSIALYPVVLAAGVTVLLSALSRLFGGRRWARVLLLTGAIQSVGYVAVSRAMFWTDGLAPEQLLFSFVAIGITTKIVVFSPPLLVRIGNPTLAPSFSTRHITVGVAGSWLIQSSLALIYLFPNGVLGDITTWMLPFSLVSVFVPLLLVGIVVVQVVMAGRIYEAFRVAPQAGDFDMTSTADPIGDAAVTDGGYNE